jgi:hypothetical protein
MPSPKNKRKLKVMKQVREVNNSCFGNYDLTTDVGHIEIFEGLMRKGKLVSSR